MMRFVNVKNPISLVILISAIFFISGIRAMSQPPIQPPGLDIAIQVQEAHTPELLGKPEVVGTAVGLDDQGKPVIQVFTRSERFSGIPNNIEGFPVEVVITGQFFALGKCTDKDGDGYPRKTGGCISPAYDCNDNNKFINPGPNTTEVCDGIDNNCNFLVDEPPACDPTPTPTPTPGPTPTPTPGPTPTPTPGPTPTPTPGPTPTPTPAPTPTPTPAPTPTPTPAAPTPTPTPAPTPTPSPGTSCNTTDRCPRPVPIGVSIGNENDCSAGTYGFRGKIGTDVFAVSNNHVMALSNSGSPGDWIMQPGNYDQIHCLVLNVPDIIGDLSDFEPIQFCDCFLEYPDLCVPNQVDAAIAISPSTAYNIGNGTDIIGNATPSNGYGTPKSTIISPAVGMNVKKYGRTTEQTFGQISAINATVGVQYTYSDCALFVGQIIIKPGTFSAAGDSGSLIVGDGGANDRKPVGLLFAGSSSFTVGNPIDAVLATFGMTVDGE